MEINLAFAMLLTALAGLSTGIGSAIAFFIRTPKYSYLSVLLGFSAGVMIYISFTELLGTAIADVGFATANIAFFIGILFIAVIDILVPHEYEEEHTAKGTRLGSSKERQLNGSGLPQRLAVPSQSSLMRSGVLLTLGIAIHNFPEGLVTFTCAATGDVAFGIMIAVAIAIHNIPEGIAVSVPIFYATGSRRRAFTYSFLSGIAEPVGALIGYAILLPFLTPTLLSCTLAFVAGIMIYISLDEILPLAHRYGREHLVIIGVGAGMLVMAASLLLLQ
ncbi:MAG: zinc transporter ZupT [Chloroflexota bacterium]|nr:zinc transporter ZupT [Chloroflexota bacterium]